MSNIKRFLKQFNEEATHLLIHTGDGYYLKDLNSTIQEIILENKGVDFNFDCYDDETFDTEAIVNGFYKAPFMSKKRVILINKIEKIDYNKINSLAHLLTKKKKTFLIFVATEIFTKEKLNRKFFKGFPQKNILELSPPKKEDIQKFIIGFMKKEKRDISKEAIFTLSENIDNNFMQAENELIKLINGVVPEKEITDKDVLNISYAQNNYTAFDLLNFILDNNKSSSLKILKKYFENTPNSELIKFYGLLHFQFQKTLLFYYYKSKGYSFSEASKSSSLNYFDQKRIKSQNGNINFNKLLRQYEILLEYEPLIKFGGNISYFQMENMVMKIIEV